MAISHVHHFVYHVGKRMPCLPSPRKITIFIGGMITIPKWVVYGIVLPTLPIVFPYIYIYVYMYIYLHIYIYMNK